jgi:hypothetical protein
MSAGDPSQVATALKGVLDRITAAAQKSGKNTKVSMVKEVSDDD